MRTSSTLAADGKRRVFGFEALLLAAALLLDVRCVNEDSNCAAQTSCDGCAALPSCGWCANTGQCVLGTHDGPTTGVCPGNWAWSPSTCATADACALHTTCGTCTTASTPDRSTRCQWNAGSQQCIAVSDGNPPAPGHEIVVNGPSGCLCLAVQTCTTCLALTGCGVIAVPGSDGGVCAPIPPNGELPQGAVQSVTTLAGCPGTTADAGADGQAFNNDGGSVDAAAQDADATSSNTVDASEGS